jgi:ferritin-like metal-binding protein YciE
MLSNCWTKPLAEEKKTDDALTKLADTAVNAEAA